MTIDKMLEKQERLLKRDGWYAHLIFDDESMPYGANYHTHGMKENLDHADIQIVLPLPPAVLEGIFHTCAENIKEGARYEPNKEYQGILAGGFTVKFITAIESGREVLRMIFADQNNDFEKWPEQYLATGFD